MTDTTIEPQIDLTRHGVIEAHAGTGKTHTIVELVLRILEQEILDSDGRIRRVYLREILLVTFTEKAAGELVRRIREGLERRIAQLAAPGRQRDNALLAHLESCRNNLHEPLIGTIHSVCLRILRTWPFETGVPFETGLVDDTEGLERTLREAIRTEWQQVRSVIPWAIARIAEQGKRFTAANLKLIRALAAELLDSEHAALDRTVVAGHTLESLERRYVAVERRLAQELPALRQALERFTDALERAREAGWMNDKRREILNRRLAELRQMARGDDFQCAVLCNPLRVGRNKIFLKADERRKEAAAALRYAEEVAGHDAVRTMNERDELRSLVLLTLVCDAAEMLAARWNRTKREQGLISYTDMLRLTYRAVCGNERFLAALRSRLRFGVIDEFQDTSALQWEVFRRIFVDDTSGRGPRLFVVGDPKQSIFSFQGADVNSYLEARNLICERGGCLYRLTKNYRSRPEIVESVNAVVAAGNGLEDWFSIPGISYTREDAAHAVERSVPPQGPLPAPALQIMGLVGSAPRRRASMVEAICEVIRALRGTRISVPKGSGWAEITLDHEHVAVLVETHALAKPVLDAFTVANIPAVKYKMEGVFSSAMARDLTALLGAIVHRQGEPAPRLAALLTHFFNRDPAHIDPERDLEPCATGPACRGDALCIAHALEEWSWLADTMRWAQLFHSIEMRTGVRERLIRLRDGERHLADLRQVVDYCLEKLYRENMGLERLVEHLGMLYRGEAAVGQDQDLHVLATSRSCVKVLTIHAAKGLQFPVVFVVTGAPQVWQRHGTCVTLTEHDGRRRVTAVLTADDWKRSAEAAHLRERYLRQKREERRRLLYVALTRAQAMLFVPLHLEELGAGESLALSWAAGQVPSRGGDEDLTPWLQELLRRVAEGKEEQLDIQVFNIADWKSSEDKSRHETTRLREAVPGRVPDMASLRLLSRICRQTSYSQLSRMRGEIRASDHSEEPEEDGDALAEMPLSRRPALPGGARTGDAVHLALEELLRSRGPGGFSPADIEPVVSAWLARNGVLKQVTRMAEKEGRDPETCRQEALAAAVTCVHRALTCTLSSPNGPPVVIGGLDRRCRIPEMEFLLSVPPHWVHGYMDLVFRIPCPGARHPWRYIVLDWKSDTLPVFDREHIEQRIRAAHYDLQARLYCHALDRYLAGLLEGTYDPYQNLGGAVYVFLRGVGAGTAYQWSYPADPDSDCTYVRKLLT